MLQKILENNKNIQSIISVNTNILLRRFRLKFLRIMYSISCYKEHLNFENTLYLRSFYNGAFSIASKHDFDDQFFLLATVLFFYLFNSIYFSLHVTVCRYLKSSKINQRPEVSVSLVSSR
jgi:hypothetical protein